jgi:hypothetical protein
VVFSSDVWVMLPWWTTIATMVDGDCCDQLSHVLHEVWRQTSPELDDDLARARYIPLKEQADSTHGDGSWSICLHQARIRVPDFLAFLGGVGELPMWYWL